MQATVKNFTAACRQLLRSSLASSCHLPLLDVVIERVQRLCGQAAGISITLSIQVSTQAATGQALVTSLTTAAAGVIGGEQLCAAMGPVEQSNVTAVLLDVTPGSDCSTAEQVVVSATDDQVQGPQPGHDKQLMQVPGVLQCVDQTCVAPRRQCIVTCIDVEL
jgi:hypothetical protein